jgi:hypothetical protein
MPVRHAYETRPSLDTPNLTASIYNIPRRLSTNKSVSASKWSLGKDRLIFGAKKDRRCDPDRGTRPEKPRSEGWHNPQLSEPRHIEPRTEVEVLTALDESGIL